MTQSHINEKANRSKFRLLYISLFIIYKDLKAYLAISIPVEAFCVQLASVSSSPITHVVGGAIESNDCNLISINSTLISSIQESRHILYQGPGTTTSYYRDTEESYIQLAMPQLVRFIWYHHCTNGGRGRVSGTFFVMIKEVFVHLLMNGPLLSGLKKVWSPKHVISHAMQCKFAVV